MVKEYLTKQFALKEGVGKSQFEQTAKKQGWIFKQEVKEKLQQTPYQQNWAVPVYNISVTYIYDSYILVDYVEITAENMKRAEWYVSSVLPVYSEKEILELLTNAKTKEEKITVLRKASVGAPKEFNQSFFKAIAAEFKNSDLDIAVASIEAVSYLPWKEFKKALEEVAKGNFTGSVEAKEMLPLMDEQGWK